MLGYLRKHAGKILIITVTFFALSIIIPVIIQNMSRRGPERAARRQLNSVGIALVNGEPISVRKFGQLVNQGVNTVKPPQQKERIDPRIMARIMYTSLMQTVDHTLMLKEAKRRRIRAGRGEVNKEVDNVKQAYKIQDNAKLKEMLKRNGYTLKQFKQMIKDEITVQKLVKNIQGEATVTDQDVLNKFKKVKARHILIQPDYEAIAGDRDKAIKEAEKLAFDKANELHKRIGAGEDFAKLAEEFSADKANAKKGGDLGWFAPGQMVPEFEQTAFTLQKGELGQPVKTVFGYHIIKIDDVKQGEIPIDVDEAELKKQMLEQKRKNHMDNWYAHLFKNIDIEIIDKNLLAIKHRVEGNYDKALQEYKLLGANNPSDPMAHVFVGEVYQDMGKLSEARSEYQRGLLKIKLDPALDNPFIYQAMGALQMKRGYVKDALAQFKKAEDLGGDNLSLYITLKDNYVQYGHNSSAKRMDRKIAQLRSLFSGELDSELKDILSEEKTAKPKLETPEVKMPEAPKTLLPPIEGTLQ